MNNVQPLPRPGPGFRRAAIARTGGLFLALAAGALSAGAYVLSSLIPPLIALMLFCSSLDLPLSAASFRGTVWRILAGNFAVAFFFYLAFFPFDRELALVAFLTGMTPTAISAPVVMGFLGGRAGYVVAAGLLTNVVVALAMPLILPLVAGSAAGGTSATTFVLLRSIALVVLVPLALSRAVFLLPAAPRRAISGGKALSFPLFLVVLFLVTANSVHFITHGLHLSPGRLSAIAAISFLVCGVNFAAGALLGGKGWRREGSQSLGQKNNAFTIWLALSFVSPVVALGPTFYVIYHNVYNSYQIFAYERRRARGDP